ncbi:MAG: Ger(x)C family spore germination protein [Firmicutes bacterium HGW-Firmicutes-12]|nr:MAG: Ger(x)C family spore germination protein [Firmicutes bacterium HGW-Firmicutes-12]
MDNRLTIVLRKTFLLMFVFSIIFISGCWSRRELNYLAIVVSFGIDKGKGQEEVIVSHQIIKPAAAKAGGKVNSTSGASPSAVWTLTSSGKTFFDAIRKGAMQSSRRLYYGHNKVIIIGEEAAREGIAPYLDLAGRDPELRPGVWLFIAKGATAEEIIKAKLDQNPISANVMDNLASVSRASSYSATIHIEEFLRKISSGITAAYASRIEIIKSQSEAEQDTVEFRLSGTSVFREDKLIGWLEEKETRGMLWVLGEIRSGIIVVKSPDNKSVGLEILRAKSKIAPEIRAGKLVIVVEIKAEANLGDSNSQLDLTTPERIAKLNEQQQEVIEDEIRSCLAIAQQEYRVDLFGFGEAIHRKYPEDWKTLKDKWEEIYPTILVELKIATNINRYGMISEPALKE